MLKNMQTRSLGIAVALVWWVKGISDDCLQRIAFSGNSMAISCLKDWEVALFFSEYLLDSIIIITIIIMAES